MRDFIVRLISCFIINREKRKIFRKKLRRPNSFIRLINRNSGRIKLGISFNLFDGEELLRSNLKNMRPIADHVCVVYQTVSNYGNKSSSLLQEFLESLVEEGLIDELYHYEPNLNKSAHWNESNKRNIGVSISAKNGCTHFLNCDVDEFYDVDSINFAKEFIEDKCVNITAVPYFNYIKLPIYREKKIAGYVPFICKIVDNLQIGSYYFPCRVDPTRAVNSDGRFYIFEPKQISMHHMTTIRSDLEKKLSNTTYNQVNTEELARYNDYYIKSSEFVYGYNDNFDVDIVENIFNIDISR